MLRDSRATQRRRTCLQLLLFTATTTTKYCYYVRVWPCAFCLVPFIARNGVRVCSTVGEHTMHAHNRLVPLLRRCTVLGGCRWWSSVAVSQPRLGGVVFERRRMVPRTPGADWPRFSCGAWRATATGLLRLQPWSWSATLSSSYWHDRAVLSVAGHALPRPPPTPTSLLTLLVPLMGERCLYRRMRKAPLLRAMAMSRRRRVQTDAYDA
jgi:hypothetical protein